jgi:hypothetical protein
VTEPPAGREKGGNGDMSRLHSFDWRAEVSLTRTQIRSLGVLADLVGNLEEDYGKQFPSSVADIDWPSLRGVFHEFRRMYKADQEMCNRLVELVQLINQQC